MALQQATDPNNSGTYLGYDPVSNQGIAFSNEDSLKQYFPGGIDANAKPANFDVSGLLANPDKFNAYTPANFSDSNPPQTFDTNTTSAAVSGSGATSQDIANTLSDYQTNHDKYLTALDSYLAPSTDEANLAAELASYDYNTAAAQKGMEGQGRGIPAQLVYGDQQKLQAQRDLSKAALAAVYNSKTATRELKLNAATTLYNANESHIANILDIYSKTAPQNLTTQYNQTTGDIFAVTRNPMTGAVTTTKVGNAGPQKTYLSSDIKQDATGQYIFYGVKADGSIETHATGIMGTPPQKFQPVYNYQTGNYQAFDPATGTMKDVTGGPTTTTTTGGGGSTGLGPTATLNDFFNKYAPSSDGNTPAQYAQIVAQALGLKPTDTLSNITPDKIPVMANAIIAHEDMAKNYPELNNPGGLKFVGQPGAVMGRNGFAAFNSYQDGYNALVNDISAKVRGGSTTNANTNKANPLGLNPDILNLATQAGFSPSNQDLLIAQNVLTGQTSPDTLDKRASGSKGVPNQYDRVMNLVRRMVPNFNENNANINYAATKSAVATTAATVSNLVKSQQAAIDHLKDSVLPAVKLAGLSDNQITNNAKIWYSDKIQRNQNIQNLQSAVDIVRGEIAGVLAKGSAPTDADKASAAQILPYNISPSTFSSLTDQITKMMQAKIDEYKKAQTPNTLPTGYTPPAPTSSSGGAGNFSTTYQGKTYSFPTQDALNQFVKQFPQ